MVKIARNRWRQILLGWLPKQSGLSRDAKRDIKQWNAKGWRCSGVKDSQQTRESHDWQWADWSWHTSALKGRIKERSASLSHNTVYLSNPPMREHNFKSRVFTMHDTNRLKAGVLPNKGGLLFSPLIQELVGIFLRQVITFTQLIFCLLLLSLLTQPLQFQIHTQGFS